MYVRKEAVLSSQIEGTQASLTDVLEAEAQVISHKRPRDVAEVLNYVSAMNYGLAKLNEIPLSSRLIREIHGKLMAGVRGDNMQPGEVRTIQNWIGAEGATLAHATYVPPPPTQVADALHQLEIFLNEESDLPALIRFGLAHAQFETIHPFLDGNGRMGRLLVKFLLCRDEILSKPVLYISHYLMRHRARYYDLLQATREDGDWESWLNFFLTGIYEVSNEASATARKIVDLREAHRESVTDSFGRAAGNGLKLLEHLFRMPVVTVQTVAAFLDLTYTGASNLVNKLEENGLLNEITGQSRNRVFRYEPYIALFSEG
tara:strand:- start:196 stop:1146 length:951 start_codon:yes stop_codon:yes gene_type:complete